MKRDCSPEEVAELWTLTPEERLLVFTKTGPTGLGFAALLKFFQAKGRFPYHPQEVPRAAIEQLSRQTGFGSADWWRYDWQGRTIKNHRAEIRALLGFREPTVADADSMADWLQAHVAHERNPERVKVTALERFRELRIEPPAPDRVDRLVHSAIASHEAILCATVMKRLPPTSRARLDALLQALPAKAPKEAGDSAIAIETSRTPLHQLRSEPGKACLETIEEELAKLELVRSLELPANLFAEVTTKTLQSYRQRVAVEELFELRRHPEPLRITLLAVYCHLRSLELTDTLLELLLEMVHRISSRAEKRVEEELRRDVRHVPGKHRLLFRIAEAAVTHPEGTIRDVLFPVVSERTFRDLVAESRSAGPAYRDQLQKVMRNTYRSHYRRMLTRLLETLDFRSNNDRHRPVMEALALIRKHVDSRQSVYPSDEIVPIEDVVPEPWRAIVVEQQEGGASCVNRIAYEICVLETLRERLRTKEIWVQGANRYRNPDEDLPADFERKRDDYYSALHLPQDGKAFVAAVRRELEEELGLFNDDLPKNKAVHILEKGNGLDLALAGRQAARTTESAPSQGRDADPMGEYELTRHAERGRPAQSALPRCSAARHPLRAFRATCFNHGSS